MKRILVSAALIGLVASPVIAATTPAKSTATKTAATTNKPASTKAAAKPQHHTKKMVKKTAKTK